MLVSRFSGLYMYTRTMTLVYSAMSTTSSRDRCPTEVHEAGMDDFKLVIIHRKGNECLLYTLS